MKTNAPMRLFAAAALIILTPTASAAVIIPSSASTDMGSGFDTSLVNTINGVGLTSFPSSTSSHSATLPDNSWVSSGTLSGTVTFNLGGMFNVAGLSFWNQNAGGPEGSGITGINRVNILASTDGTNFSLISGAPVSFAQETSLTSTAQQFSFASVQASHIRFSILSNHGDNAQTGFAEVAFESSARNVPDGGTTALLGLIAFSGLGVARRFLRS